MVKKYTMTHDYPAEAKLTITTTTTMGEINVFSGEKMSPLANWLPGSANPFGYSRKPVL